MTIIILIVAVLMIVLFINQMTRHRGRSKY